MDQLYVNTNGEGSLYEEAMWWNIEKTIVNDTNLLNGLSNSTSWNVSLNSGNYKWNCLGYDNASWSDWGTNRSFSVNQTYVLGGTVKDGSGAAVVGAHIFVLANGTSDTIIMNTTSGAGGIWNITDIQQNGFFTICAYDPTNTTLRGDCTPFVELP